MEISKLISSLHKQGLNVTNFLRVSWYNDLLSREGLQVRKRKEQFSFYATAVDSSSTHLQVTPLNTFGRDDCPAILIGAPYVSLPPPPPSQK